MICSFATRKIYGWQIYIAFTGTLAWFTSLQFYDYALERDWVKLHNIISGYIIGFITALAGWVFWETVQGRGKKFITEQSFLRLLPLISVIVICIIGFGGFIRAIWGTNDWTYGLGAAAGSIVIGKGIIPIMGCLEEE